MKSISFKNFRRFSDFPEFKFGDITILVGGNNAGKSTFLKALILLIDNFRELQTRNNNFIFESFWPVFSFDMDHTHQLSLGTYNRAHKFGADEGITFETEIDKFRIKIVIKAANETEENSPTASITSISISDTKRNINFDYNRHFMSIEFKNSDNQGSININADDYVNLISGYDITIPHNPIARLIYNWIGYQSLHFEKFTGNYELSDPDEIKKVEKQCTLKDSEIGAEEKLIERLIEGEDTIELHKSNQLFLEDKISIIQKIANELNDALYKLINLDDIYYIPAQVIAQSVIYTIDNKNDYVAKILHKFHREGIRIGSDPDKFLRDWLDKFEVGNNYRISPLQGEGYTLEIETSSGVWRNLADLGMGSNHLVVLLMELAILLKVKGNKQHPLIIIEEPEQNLHPKMQSKIAELFYELNKDRGFRFLVETHSEYLIRRSQVYVAKKNLSEEDLEKQNPFKVYFFPENGTPYDMKYTNNGHFEEAFGEGFFDEAGKWTRELTRNKSK